MEVGAGMEAGRAAPVMVKTAPEESNEHLK